MEKKYQRKIIAYMARQHVVQGQKLPTNLFGKCSLRE